MDRRARHHAQDCARRCQWPWPWYGRGAAVGRLPRLGTGLPVACCPFANGEFEVIENQQMSNVNEIERIVNQPIAEQPNRTTSQQRENDVFCQRFALSQPHKGPVKGRLEPRIKAWCMHVPDVCDIGELDSETACKCTERERMDT